MFDPERMHRLAWWVVRHKFATVPCDVAEPEDLVQVALLALYRRVPRFNASRSSERSFAISVMDHGVMDWLRAATHWDRGRKVSRFVHAASLDAHPWWLDDGDAEGFHETIPDSRDEIAELESNLAIDAIREIVYQMPYISTRTRYATLRIIDGELQATVGEELGVSESRVCQMIRPVFERLRHDPRVREALGVPPV